MGAFLYLLFDRMYSNPNVDSITTGDTIKEVTLNLDASAMPITEIGLETYVEPGVALACNTTRAVAGLTSDPLTYRMTTSTLDARFLNKKVKLFL